MISLIECINEGKSTPEKEDRAKELLDSSQEKTINREQLTDLEKKVRDIHFKLGYAQAKKAISKWNEKMLGL